MQYFHNSCKIIIRDLSKDLSARAVKERGHIQFILARLFQAIAGIKFQSEGFMLLYLHFNNNGEIFLILQDSVLFRLQIAIFIN